MTDFDVFWAKYPKRVAKLEAQKAWAKLQPPITDVLAALDWQTLEWDDVRFVPHPATWIRAGRWMDEQPKVSAPAVKADMHGHVPPCRSINECIAKVIADGRQLKAVNE